MSDNVALLKRFQPQLRYDSNEQYFADGAEQYVVNPGNELRRASGEVIARAGDPKLTLQFLGRAAYGDGTPVQKTDVIGVHGRNYRAQYVALRTSRPELNNRMYGRAVTVNERLWLQYWFWYFYNDYELAFGVGLHEGDWEMVQLRMAPDLSVPDVAVYAQHKHGEKRAWSGVEKLDSDPDKPVVYVARGSHASYFEAGFHQTEAFYDVADGKRRPPAIALEIVAHDKHGWMHWPGRWGDSAARKKAEGIDQPSPTGPGSKKHWRDPNRLLNNAVAPVLKKPPPAPDVKITRSASNTLQIAYDFSARADKPSTLVVTVNSRNEKGVPPIKHTFEIAGKPKDVIQTDVPLAPSRHYDVYTSTIAGDPPLPSASDYSEVDPIKPEEDVPFTTEVAQRLGGLLARIRGDR